jgi:hypothetical protein
MEFNTASQLERDDGTLFETLGELLQAHTDAPEGESDYRVDVSDARWLPYDGGRLRISAVSWHVSVRAGTPTVVQQEGRGVPKLVVQQIGTEDKVTFGRLLIDEHLWAWDLDPERNVVPRGRLAALPDALD